MHGDVFSESCHASRGDDFPGRGVDGAVGPQSVLNAVNRHDLVLRGERASDDQSGLGEAARGQNYAGGDVDDCAVLVHSVTDSVDLCVLLTFRTSCGRSRRSCGRTGR